MFFLFLVVQLSFVTVPAVIFEDCGSAYELHSVDIKGCGWSLPCYVTLGQQTPVDVEFFADFSSNLLDQDVVINVNLVNVNADVTPDPCVTVDCPVATGAINSFTSVMSVPSGMALNQRGYLHWRVYNEKRQLVVCYSVLVQTQSRRQSKLRELLTRITPDHANSIVDSLDEEEIPVEDQSTPENYLQIIVAKYFESSRQRNDYDYSDFAK